MQDDLKNIANIIYKYNPIKYRNLVDLLFTVSDYDYKWENRRVSNFYSALEAFENILQLLKYEKTIVEFTDNTKFFNLLDQLVKEFENFLQKERERVN